MDKMKTSLDGKTRDFEISNSLRTASTPFKINIMHNYISDKAIPERPSVQPRLETKVSDPPSIRKSPAPCIKPPEPGPETPARKEVKFEKPSDNSEKPSIRPETLQQPRLVEERPAEKPEGSSESLSQMSPINEDPIILSISSEQGSAFSNKKKKVHKTVIIVPESAERDPDRGFQPPGSPEQEGRGKRHTYSSPNKRKGRSDPRNAKLAAFSRIVDPLEKIDQENQASLDLQASKQKLIFSDSEEKIAKFPTFAVLPLEDLGKRVEDLEVNVGKFTALRVSASFLLIGTQHGFLLIYSERKGLLKHVHSGNESYQNNAITAIDVSPDEEIAVAGFSSSQVELFDLQGFTSLKVFKNLHSTPILALRFFHSNPRSSKNCKVLSSDNAGKVMTLTFEKGLFSYDCERQLVIDRTYGQITQIELLQSPRLDKETVIVAMASLIRVLILQLEPKVTRVFTLPKPDSILERFPASVVWTEGAFYREGEETALMLLVSWGPHYFLVNLEPQTQKPGPVSADRVYRGQLVAHLMLRNYVKFTIFLSNRIFLSLTDEDRGVLANLEDFEEVPEKDSRPEERIDEVLKALDHGVSFESQEFEVRERLVFHSLIKDRDNMARSCFAQSYAGTVRSGLLLLQEDRVSVFSLFTWQKLVNSMINSGDRLTALAALIRIFKGEEKYVAGVPEVKAKRFDCMREYAETMAQDYLILGLNVTENKEEKAMRRLILTVSEFLIEIEDSEFLFTEIQKVLQQYELGERFLEGLEAFILKGKIRYMPETALQSTVNFFKSRGKLELIQRLIVSLDLKKVDALPLINLCLELHFFKALIYICTIYCEDFMTPLIKIYSLYDSSRKSPEGTESKDLGLRCLWYLKTCLKGETVLQNQIPAPLFELIAQQLLVWLFEVEHLRSLVQVDERTFFDIIALFFAAPVCEIINRNTENIKLRPPSTLSPGELDIIKNMDSPVLNVMIAILYHALIEDPENRDSTNSKTLWFYLFVGRLIVQRKYYVSPRVCYGAVVALLEKPSFLENVNRDKMLFDLTCSDDEKELEKSQFLLNIVKYCERELSREQTDQLLRVAEISPFAEINHYVNYLVGDYPRCFEIMLASKNKVFQRRIHEWLESTLNSLLRPGLEGKKAESSVRELKELILARLTELMQINSEKTHRIITKFMKSLEKSVIKSLSLHPRLQMEYLERIINSRETGEFIDNDLLLVHIELLCKDENETKLLNILKTRDYPLNESLKLCQSYKRNEATAFLLERTGAIEEALVLYLDIFERNIEYQIKLAESKKAAPTIEDQIMRQTVNSILSLCRNHKNYDFENGEDLWFKLLDKMIELDQQKIAERSKDPRFLGLTLSFKRILGIVFEEISKNITLLSLLKNIREKYFEMNLGYLKNTFMAMISNFSYEKNILNLAKQLVAEANYHSVSRLLSNCETGYYNVPFCLICLENLDQKAKKILFFCGHCYHRKCIEVSICPICKTNDKFAFEKVIFKYKVKIEKIVSGNNTLEGATHRMESLDDNEELSPEERGKKNFETLDLEKKEKLLYRKRKMDRLRISDRNREEELQSIQNFIYKYKDQHL